MVSTVPSPAAPSENPLRVEVCPDCGYSLEGLPEEGHCPECGRRYDSSLIVLYGWGRDDHANVGNCTPETLVGYAVMGGILLAALFLFLSDAPKLILLILGLACIM